MNNDLLEGEERKLLRKWNATDAEAVCIHELFEEQVGRTPDATALVHEGQSLSYAELNRQANQLAHYLIGLGVKPDVRVAICVERSPEMIIGLLGVLKAGGAYVPMDLAYPMDRLRFMLEDSDPLALLTQAQLREKIGKLPPGLRVLDLMDIGGWSGQPESNPKSANVGQPPEHLAYMIYTSGSTGNPKGVLIEHRAVCNRIRALQEQWQICAQDRVLQFASIAFDASVEEIFGALLSGATLVLRGDDWLTEAREFWGLLGSQRITVVDLPTRFWSQMVADRSALVPLSIRLVIIGGEAVERKALADWFERDGHRPELWNTYGPTETTIDATLQEVKADASNWNSIGSPIANTRVYILDGRKQPIPVGVTGELYIAGAGVARGYWNRPELTASGFLADPFAEEAAARMYKSGDLGRWLPDGTIEFVGRNDFQVKLRGFRIELGEIEEQLAKHPAVRDAVVIARQDSAEEKKLVAYYVMDQGYRGTKEHSFLEAQKDQQLSGWATAYDALYSQADSFADAMFNVVGWNSTYTEQPIAAEEMREWLETTVERIGALQPKRVLEIGCGTGLLLFRIAPKTLLYHGTDVSPVALNFLRQQLQRPELQMSQVVLECRPAHQPINGKFDLAVLNSVVQYFPDVQYLMTVLTHLAQLLQPGGAIFIGDVRSYTLLETFHTSVALYQAPESLSCDDLRQKVQRSMWQERELVIDPAFFTALPQHLPRINRVEIHLKRGRARNELSCFRYDVVLHCGDPIAEIECKWVDWKQGFLTLGGVREILNQTQTEALGIQGIPNARLQRDVAAVQALNATQPPATVGMLRKYLEGEQHNSVEPEDLWNLAGELGYAVEVRFSQCAPGTCDVVFLREEVNWNNGESQGIVKFPGADEPMRALDSYMTDPVRNELATNLPLEFRNWLALKLPEYMVPAVYVRMKEMRLTANGKLDRAALPPPQRDAYATHGYEAPEGEIERMLAESWLELLQVERVGRHDNFFAMGGHSLQAVTLMERIRQRGFEVDVAALFSSPTLAGLAASLKEKIKVHTVTENRIPIGAEEITPQMLPLVALTAEEINRIVSGVKGGAPNVQDIYPLTPLQEGILFHHLMHKETDPYLLITQMSFDTRLRLDRYLAAMQKVIDRHDILRTSMVWEGLREPLQVVWRSAHMQTEEVELNGVDGDAATHMYAQLDPRRNRLDVRQAPMLRAYVGHDAAKDRWLLSLLMHHLLGDHTTEELIEEEIEAQLSGQEHLLPAPLPFRNLVAQARFGLSREKHEAFFRQMLADVVEPTAPFGLLNVQGDGTEVEEDRIMLDPALSRRLRTQARMLNVSPASLCHLAWGRVLAQVSDRADVVFGTVLFGRMQGGLGADRVMGLCINTLPVRLQIGKEAVVASARKAHRALAELMRHEHAPLVLAQRCSGVAAPTPLFSALLNCHHSKNKNKTQALSAEGVDVLRMEERSNYPFSLLVEDLEADFRLMAQVQGEVRARRVCQYMQTTLESLVTALEADPDMPVSTLQVLPNGERQQLLYEWNATEVEYPCDKCVHELFEEQVEKTPEAAAVVFEEEELSYGELNARANQLAHYLTELGVRPDDRVGICAERSLEMVVGLLAILKAGGAYVPLNPSYPAERLQYIVEDSTLVALLTQDHLRSLFQELHAGLLVIDMSEGSQWREQPEANPDRSSIGVTSGHLAYVIYTSGSTGTPKGVTVQHGNVVNSTLARKSSYQNSGRFLLLSPISFDSSVAGILGTLTNGDSLLVATQAIIRDPSCLNEYIKQFQVQSLLCVPSLYQQIIEDESGYRHRQLFRVIVAGEPCPPSLVAKSAQNRPHVELCNEYGPTEATVWASMHRCSERSAEPSVPIGRPIANTRIYILDGQGEPVPVGVAGGLYIGGAGVARGYQGRSALTAEKFVPDPYARAAGARMYKTGDLARWLPDGNIEFLGRNDFQVKIRGFRIELGEIEAHLMEHPSVREAVVVAREYAAGDKRLVAYYTSSAATDPEQEVVEAEQMRRHLSASLPEYMVPAAYVRLESLPLTWNGKLDRKALPAPEGKAYGVRQYEAPQGAIEELLAGIWGELLKLERVGRHDNFFALGGHSLLAVTLMELVRRHGFKLDVRSLFATPTIAALAATVDSAASAIKVPANRILSGCEQITPEMLSLIELAQEEIDRVVQTVPGGAANVQEIYPPAPLQEGILFHHLMGGEGDPYLLASLWSFDTREQLDNYRKALQAVIDRRDILRTAVLWERLREPVQVVWRQAPLQVEEVKVDPAAGDVSEQLYARFDPRHFRIDVQQAPLLRLYLAYDSAHDRWLMMQLHHHLVVDHSTLEVMQAEIQAHLLGQQEQLPEPLPFRNLVAQARLGISQEEHEGFFRRMLGNVDEPTAPFGLLDVRGDGSNNEEACLALDTHLARRLRTHARSLGTSAASLCHLAWARVLSTVSGRDDVVFGTVLLGRMQGGEGADQVMGLFINTLPVRISVGEEGVENAVRQTHVSLADLMRHEHASLALAQRCSAVPVPAPLFSSLFNYRHSLDATQIPSAEAMQAWQGIQELRNEERTNYPLTLSVNDLGEGISLDAQTLSSVGAMRICEFMRTALESLADALETSSTKPVRALDILPKAERQRVLYEWNATEVEYPRDKCVHELFAEQVEKTPEATAVVFEEEELSYGELNARANRLAHYLIELGVRPDDRVAICAERGLEMVVGLLGVLKAGGAYVPLDPEYPVERLRFMIEDSTPAALLTQSHLEKLFVGIDDSLPVLDLTSATPPWQERPETNPRADAIGLGPRHLAYVIYTSGSTGTPKGVLVEHANIVRLLTATEVWFHFGCNDVWTLFHSYGFDFSVWEMWGCLSYGGRLVVVPKNIARAPEDFYKLLCKEKVTVLNQTPSAFRQLIGARAASAESNRLQCVIFGGEALDVAALKPWYKQNYDHGPQLVNMYGITETTVHVTYRPLEHEDTQRRGGSPIGCRIPDLRIYILDAHREPVPVGVAGELYIGGAGIARGYLNRAELTAEKFVSDPFVDEADARMYRTGDLGRWLGDGNIEFVGRNDHQVKVRGFRIELGEIEARLRQHAGVREAVVLAFQDEDGDKRLVAYAVPERAYSDSFYAQRTTEQNIKSEIRLPEKRLSMQWNPNQFAATLRSYLEESLPEYMVPAAYVCMEALPLTPNGKLDRKALPAPKGEAYGVRQYEAPQGAIEELLAGIWGELLKLERVGRHDNFFALGGHSLLGIRLLSRIRSLLGVEVAIRDLFAHPVLSDLAHALESTTSKELSPIVALKRDARATLHRQTRPERIPLSFTQERLWFSDRLQGTSTEYSVSEAMRVKGELDYAALRRTVGTIVERHEILRTRYVEVEGEVVQVIEEGMEIEVGVEDVSGLEEGEREEWVREATIREWEEPFDLENGPPLRMKVLKVEEREHIVQWTMHHIVMDEWSLGIWNREFKELYGAYREGRENPLPELGVQYADFALWQREKMNEERMGEELRYWKEQLAGLETLDLPTDRARPAVVSYDGAAVQMELGEELTRRIRELCRREGVTLFMVLLGGLQVLLRLYTGQQDVVVGVPIANRTPPEIEPLIGFFANTLVLRGEVRSKWSFLEMLKRVREITLAAYAHQDLPFEHLVEELQPVRDLRRSPLVEVMLKVQDGPQESFSLPGLSLEVLGMEDEEVTKPDLTAIPTWFRRSLIFESAGESAGNISIGINYMTELYEQATIERMGRHFRAVLEEMTRNTDSRIGEVIILSDTERAQLQGWNRTKQEYPQRWVHELFEDQVARTPEAVAVEYEDEWLNYQELNRRSNQLAHHLRSLGVGPEVRVALFLERGLQMVVAIMAVLKAGGAYLPLDPSYPPERLSDMLERSAAPVLLGQARLQEKLLSYTGKIIHVDAEWGTIGRCSDANLRNEVSGENLAYVIYTSGSTGEPKGAMNTHQGLSNRVQWMQQVHSLAAADRVLQKTPFGFDVSVWEFLWPLIVGARLVMLRPGGHQDPACIAETIQRKQITTLHFVPAMLRVFLSYGGAEQSGNLRRIICSGGALGLDLARECRERIRAELHNLYGPAEASTDVTSWNCSELSDVVMIGKPIANTQIHVLDSDLQLVPVGVAGELYIGGAGLARGYLNQPGLTAERFVPSPLASCGGERLYRTGDRAKRHEDGNLEYLGRLDQQVKIRGYRIELGEIEAILRRHTAVGEAAVVQDGEGEGGITGREKRLVAYYTVAGAGTVPDAETLRRYLAEKLPEYMVPAAYVRVEKMPLMPNGKLNRKMLPEPERDCYPKGEYEAPQGEIETPLALIWSEVLKLERTGRHDDFFQCGGHSLLATQLISKIRSRLDLDLPLRALFERSTVARFAELIATAKKSDIPPMRPGGPSERVFPCAD